MQAIELKDFLSFYALSDLQWAPDGHAAALIAHRADEGKNGYDSNLWLYTPGKPLRHLTAQGDVKSFVWDGSEALLFPTLRDEADKALRASGEEHTAFYRLPLSGGEAERVFTVPLNASVIGKLAPSTYVLKARKDLEKERTDDEFMAMYEQYEAFDDLEEAYLDMEEQVTTLVASYVDNHLELFAKIIK